MLRAPIVLLLNLLRLLGYLWSSFWFKLGYFFRRKKKLYLELKLESSYAFGPKTGLAALFQHKPSLLELRKSIERIREDDTVAGVVIVPESTAMGHGQLAELNRLLDSLREAGKHVVGHAQMPLTRDYLLLTAADDILLSPAGRIYSFGPRFDQNFAREALDKIGVIPQFIHIGEFKTASHRFIHEEMTQAQRLMMQSLYDSFKRVLRDRIGERRGLSHEEVETFFEQAPLDTRHAWRAGFVDGEVFREVIGDWLDDPQHSAPIGYIERAHKRDGREGEEEMKRHAKERTSIMVRAKDHLDALPKPYKWQPLLRPKRRFAVLDLSGMIVMPNMTVPGQGSVVIDPHEVVPALRRIRENRRYAGAILHINSPGGSALASDIIWHAIEQLRRTKPVIAQCSDVVGSGGYYLAVGADQIICERQTMTGSIGVVTGKMSAPGTPQKLGLNVESIYEHDADRFTSLTTPLSDQMMERMDDDARNFYRRFLQRVGQARKLPRRRLHRYARGRVYLGEAALERGLIDEIGGLDTAIERLGELCDLDPDDTEVTFIGHRKESLRGALTGQLQAQMPSWMADVFEPAMIAALLKRDPVLALMPWKVE
ncbi:S49 family peptidase [Persicimonas caeni]|nr:S49 family peptidase [Persicimonas caeni]